MAADSTREAEAKAEAFREAIEIANLPTLLMVLYQLTGDGRWLEPPYRPGRPRGIDDNDDGRFDPAVQRVIRDASCDAILRWRDSGEVAVPRPSDAVLAHMLSVSMTDEIPDSYGEIIAAGLGLAPERDEAPRGALTPPPGFKVLILGGGISGICAAVLLQREGIPFEILEKNDSFGGTWYGNRYPGSGVDTPNHLYSFSFAQFDWPSYFSLREEIYAYVSSVADRFALAEHTRFGVTVEAVRYDDARKMWQVTAAGPDGPVLRDAPVVISAVGVLDVAKTPPIPGLESFPGPSFHSAHWPADLDVTGKRVAVVGNGASAMQVVPAIADTVDSMVVFARSKQWAAPFPKFKARVPEPIRFLMREVPLYQQWYRQRLAWTFNDRIHATIQKDPAWPYPDRSLNETNDAHRRAFTDYIREEIGDRQELLDDLLPDYPPFGKRMLLDNGWFRTVARDHVTLVPEHLAEVRGDTLVSNSGREFQADILVLATGFHATEFLCSIDVFGRDGRRLRDEWSGDDARAYLGTTIPGFPNFFTLLGPNIGLGHGGSIIGPVENQMNHVLSLLGKMFRAGAATIEVRQDVHDDYNERVDAAHDRMVFSHRGMENWYRNSRGRIVAITPWRHDDFWRMTRDARDEDYVFGEPDRAAAG